MGSLVDIPLEKSSSTGFWEEFENRNVPSLTKSEAREKQDKERPLVRNFPQGNLATFLEAPSDVARSRKQVELREGCISQKKSRF